MNARSLAAGDFMWSVAFGGLLLPWDDIVAKLEKQRFKRRIIVSESLRNFPKLSESIADQLAGYIIFARVSEPLMPF